MKKYDWGTITPEEFVYLANDEKYVESLNLYDKFSLYIDLAEDKLVKNNIRQEFINVSKTDQLTELNIRHIYLGQFKKESTYAQDSGIYQLHSTLDVESPEYKESLLNAKECFEAFVNQEVLPIFPICEYFIKFISEADIGLLFHLYESNFFERLEAHKCLNHYSFPFGDGYDYLQHRFIHEGIKTKRLILKK